ncbi:hypothetical protein JL722_4041 [Aureococcus anophagefferens]|nr:hypothetical protein JL722_4041 [Aureococcus anophagefferens]
MDAVLARVDYGPAASRVRHDASAALAHPLLDAVASFGDCGGSPALALVGTVAMTYRGHRYNLPVEIVLPPGYPAAPPRVFLRPTPDMSVRDRHRHVDAAGVVYLPLLSAWSPRRALGELVATVSDVFGADPPLFARPPGAAPAAAAAAAARPARARAAARRQAAARAVQARSPRGSAARGPTADAPPGGGGGAAAAAAAAAGGGAGGDAAAARAPKPKKADRKAEARAEAKRLCERQAAAAGRWRRQALKGRPILERGGACCRDLRELVPALRDATRASLGDETRADDGTEYFFEHAQFAVSEFVAEASQRCEALARGTALGFMGRARRSHRKGEVVVEEAFGAGSASSAADDGQRALGPGDCVAVRNAAVDNLLEGARGPGRLRLARLGQPEAVRPELLRYCADARSAYDAKMALVRDADVVCATCVGAGADLLDRFHFDRVLVDEAAQATEPVCLVLVGDQCQLPPTVLDAKQGEVAKPLFTRLLATVRPHLLDTQYRMHPVLSAFANDAVYAGRLCDGVHPRDRALEDRVLRSVGAAVGAEGLAAALPFALVHVRAVRRALRNAGVDCAAVGLEVSSVDAIQGREKEVVILSTVRANAEGKLGFVADWRRLNVALTLALRSSWRRPHAGPTRRSGGRSCPGRSPRASRTGAPSRRSGEKLAYDLAKQDSVKDAWDDSDSDDAGATKDGGWGDDDA